MAVGDDIRRIHDRIDELIEKFSEMDGRIAGILATCELCRRIILGNGGDPIDRRVDRLEIAAGRGSKRASFWSGAAVSLVAAIVGAAAGAYFAAGR